jgi:hypothetical protein
MRTGSSPGRGWNPRPTLLALSFLALSLLVGTGCVDRSVGPGELREAQLSLAAALPASASQQARAIDGFRVAVSRSGQGVVAEESGTVGPEESSVTVALTVLLEAPCESLLVLIELSALGEVWYRAEREHQVCAGSGNPLPTLQLEWVGPLIGLNPAQLSFSADQATNPSSQTFIVTNSGGGTLNWTASDDAPWLGVSPTSGALAPGASQTVTATVSSATLDAGQFQTTVVVTDPNAANSPQAFPVSLTVIEVANSVIRGTVSAEGEGLSGVSVTLGGKESGSTATDATGRFEVTGLTSGGYTVTIGNLPVGVSFAATTQNVSLGVNETRTVDFQGTYIRNSSISGAVTLDGAPLAEVTVTLTGTESRTATTGADGRYSFTGLRHGSYSVSVAGYPPDVTFPATTQNVSLGVNQTRTLNFQGTYVRTSSISGAVTVDGSPLAEVTVTLTGTESRTATTGADGRYSFAGLRDGSYTLDISGFPDGVSFLATSRSLTLEVGEHAQVDFAGSSPGAGASISGRISLEGSPLGGVTVTLGGTASASVTSDEGGRYAFVGLPGGSYTVSVSDFPPDVTFPDPIQEVSLETGEERTVSFQGSYVRTSSVVGVVRAGDFTLEGVTVTLTGTESRVTSTNSSGSYQFAEVRQGSYTVSISNLPAGSQFSVTSRNTTVGMGETVQVDFEGSIIPLPSPDYSYIDACPAVIPQPDEATVEAQIIVGVRDQLGNPIQGAGVSLALVPPDPGSSFFGSTSFVTGSSGLVATSFYSTVQGTKTFSAEITADDHSIILQESDDLLVDQTRWDHRLQMISGNGQTIVAGQSGSFSVRVTDVYDFPVPGVPVGWAVQGGNCFYSFANASAIAGMSLYVPPSTAPGTYQITANIAEVDWNAGTPWRPVRVTFTYSVVAPSPSPPAAASQRGEELRLRGTAVPAGGR